MNISAKTNTTNLNSYCHLILIVKNVVHDPFDMHAHKYLYMHTDLKGVGI